MASASSRRLLTVDCGRARLMSRTWLVGQSSSDIGLGLRLLSGIQFTALSGLVGQPLAAVRYRPGGRTDVVIAVVRPVGSPNGATACMKQSNQLIYALTTFPQANHSRRSFTRMHADAALKVQPRLSSEVRSVDWDLPSGQRDRVAA
jgi:hypothetical protein